MRFVIQNGTQNRPQNRCKNRCQKRLLFGPPFKTCLSKGTGSAVYVEAVRLFSFSWILVIFWMAHYNEKTCWYMSLRGAASCCL